MNRPSRDRIEQSTSDVPWPDLDGVDLELIRVLHRDGRATLAGMAKALGQSVGVARQRYERLTQRGLVSAVAVVDPIALGRQVVAHLNVHVRSGAHDVARQIAGIDEVAWMAVGTDYRSIRLQVSTSSSAALVTLINTRIRSLPQVVSVASTVLLRNWSPVFNFGGATPSSSPGEEPDNLWLGGSDSRRHLDDLDIGLLSCLEHDARSTITSIAERVGLSVPATRQRMVKLVRDGTVRFRTRPNPLADGILTATLVVTYTGDSTPVARHLATFPNVSYVLESTGEGVLHVELLCALEAQIAEAFERAVRLEGVSDVRVTRYGDVVVHSGHW